MIRTLTALVVCLLVTTATASAQWSIELTKDAAFLLRYDGATVMRAKYVAWGPKWKFAAVDSAIGRNMGNLWTIDGKIPVLDTAIAGKIQHVGDEFVFTWNFTSTQATRDAIGGGLSFDLRLDKQVFGANVPEPTLQDDGFVWEPVPGKPVKFTFEGLAGAPYFEKGRKDEIRAFVIPKDIPQGNRTATMTLTLPPGTPRVDGVSIRYAKPEPTWHTGTVDWSASPVDLSYLNHQPAGSRGFVRAQGDKLVYGDGTEARFWGTNVMAYGIFNADDATIRAQAKRLAQLGYNLVRLHHHDSAEWSPSVFVKDADNTRVLDDKALDRIDMWVAALKAEGIYVWLDLHVGRPFREGDDIKAYDELEDRRKTGRQAKGYNYVNPDVTARMKEFATQYLTRANKYTGVKYVDEPAVMGVLITNENDLTHHFGNNFLPDKKKPSHQRWFEHLRDQIINTRGLDPEKAWRTWEAGPSKVVLNQIEYDWNVDFINHLRSIGVKAPLATTNMFAGMGLWSLPALTAGDVIDVHAYGMAESIGSNPRYDDMASHWLAAAQVKDMPLVITEWNTEYPQRDRFTQPLLIAATAAFQGWDAPMIYGYQQAPMTEPNKIDKFGTSNDPSMIPLMPAAALLYRKGHVSEAKQTVVFAPGENAILKNILADNSPALRTLSERHRLVIGLPKTPLLPWLKGVDQGDAADPTQIADGIAETSVTSDTGELTRDWNEGVFTINTPRTQAVMGWVGGREISLADVTFKIDTPKAAVVVSSLDDKPIAESTKMLLTFTAQSDVGGKPKTIRAEPVTGTITFRGPVRHAALSPAGRMGALSGASASVALAGRYATHWYVITR